MATDAPTAQVFDDKIIKLLVQRRSIILSITGSTPSDNPLLTTVLNSGYLSFVKIWIEEVLNKRVGTSL